MNKSSLIYPKCANSFRLFCESNKSIMHKYVYKLIKVRPFDVTLRDGLQGLSVEQQLTMTNNEKLKIYQHIKDVYNPLNMEIGSIVSNKLFPAFNNCEILFNTVERNQIVTEDTVYKNINNNYILIPNQKAFEKIGIFGAVRCFSFITSVSNSFQMKNTRMSIETSNEQINNMMNQLNNKFNDRRLYKTKIYLSCVNECPIEGKIDNDIIVAYALKLLELKPDLLCLSDTCGTLMLDDFAYILNGLKKDEQNDKSKNISLHLHVKQGREDEVEKLIHYALDQGINSFDVSLLNSGGCSLTMDNTQIAPNLSYDLYYKCLTTYLTKD